MCFVVVMCSLCSWGLLFVVVLCSLMLFLFLFAWVASSFFCYRLCSLFLIRGSWFRVGWFFCVFVRKYCSCYVVVVRVLCS